MTHQLNRYSSRITQPKSQGASQAMLYATGLRDQDMDKPQVGISSVWFEGNPCNMHLLALAEKVKEGVVAAGLAFPCLFRRVPQCPSGARGRIQHRRRRLAARITLNVNRLRLGGLGRRFRTRTLRMSAGNSPRYAISKSGRTEAVFSWRLTKNACRIGARSGRRFCQIVKFPERGCNVAPGPPRTGSDS